MRFRIREDILVDHVDPNFRTGTLDLFALLLYVVTCDPVSIHQVQATIFLLDFMRDFEDKRTVTWADDSGRRKGGRPKSGNSCA